MEEVGSNVTVAAVGDPVLLSYNHCGECDLYGDGQPSYCVEFNERNVPGRPDIF